MIYYGVETHYNSLAHHGVKGMKWGVRKQRAIERRQRRYARRAERSIGKYRLRRDKIRATRDANEAKIRSGNTPLLSRIGTSGMTDRQRARDFRSGTSAINRGYNKAIAVEKNYAKMKSAAAADRSVKKTDAYKQARKEKVRQDLRRLQYGRDYVALANVSDEYKKKQKR